jgi:hypothetical protein
VPFEDQPLVASFRWACRSWQASASRQAHLLCRGLPQRISFAQSAESPPQRIILCRGPAQPHIEQVGCSTAGHPPLFDGPRGDDCGVPVAVVAAGRAPVHRLVIGFVKIVVYFFVVFSDRKRCSAKTTSKKGKEGR